MKKLITFLMAIIMIIELVPTMPVNVKANPPPTPASEFSFEIIRITDDEGETIPSPLNGTLRLKSYSGSRNEVTVPATVNGREVTVIGYNAFANAGEVRVINLPDTITEFEGGAFSGTQIKSVVIPPRVTEISSYMFQHSSIESLVIPSNVTTIHGSAFIETYSLRSIYIPPSVTIFGNPENHDTVDYQIFGWYGMSEDEIFDLEIYGEIGSPAQHYANKWGIKFIQWNGAFFTNMTDAEITIERSIANGRTSGVIVRHNGNILRGGIDYSVTQQENENRGLITYTITGIQANNFRGTRTETFGVYDGVGAQLPVGSTTPVTDFIFKVISEEDIYGDEMLHLVGTLTLERYTGTNPNVVVPPVVNGRSVTAIGGGNYNNQPPPVFGDHVETVILPDTVEFIGVATPWSSWATWAVGAFDGATSLKSVNIPPKVTSLGMVFRDCTSLETFIVPPNVTNLGANAFYGCSSLKSVIIPATVEYMQDDEPSYWNDWNARRVFGDHSLLRSDFTIYGELDSEAEMYALRNGLNFAIFNPNTFTDVSSSSVIVERQIDGNGITSGIIVRRSGAALVRGQDYMLGATMSQERGTITYTISGLAANNYVGFRTETFGLYTASHAMPSSIYITVVKVSGKSVIKLHNPTDRAISAKGLYLTDDLEDPYKWQMPTIIIRAGESITAKGNLDSTTQVLKRAVVNFDVELAGNIRLSDATGDVLSEWVA